MKNNINKTTLGKKTSAGFTIIEVLIVLAIAGLIILIVLLAIPALQRNNRNTARKSDVARIAGAVTNFVSNNNGAVPAADSLANANTILADAGTLGQYRAPFTGSATLADNTLHIAAGATGILVATSVDQVQIVTAVVCGTGVAAPGNGVAVGATTGAAAAGATARNIAIQYTIESGTANAVTPICQNI